MGRNVIFVSIQFPGPLVDTIWSDVIQIAVTNNIDDPRKGTCLHWHRLSFRKSFHRGTMHSFHSVSRADFIVVAIRWDFVRACERYVGVSRQKTSVFLMLW